MHEVTDEQLARLVYDALLAGGEGGSYIDEFYFGDTGDVVIDGGFDFVKVGAAMRERLSAFPRSTP